MRKNACAPSGLLNERGEFFLNLDKLFTNTHPEVLSGC